jgi:hypothetical protein
MDPHQSEKLDPHQSVKGETLEGHLGAMEGPDREKLAEGSGSRAASNLNVGPGSASK